MSGIKFTPGSLYITPGALEALKASGDDVAVYLIRHISGDWVSLRSVRLNRPLLNK
jgi:hypothetical protein